MGSQNRIAVLVLLCIIAVQGNPSRELIATFQEPLSSKDAADLLNAAAIVCGFPNDEIESLYAFKLNKTRLQEFNCASGCLIRSFGLITKTNEVDHEGLEIFLELIATSWESSEKDSKEAKWEKCDDFEGNCDTLKAKNECDLGWLLFDCLQRICREKIKVMMKASKKLQRIFKIGLLTK